MWIACNNLVHHDGEVRDTKRARNVGICFVTIEIKFKTPYWRIIKKKTEHQKVRYIETAQRLMQDSRRASQQTLDNWRLDDEDDPSTDSEEEEVSNVGIENRVVMGLDSVPNRQHQTSILEFYSATTRATA